MRARPAGSALLLALAALAALSTPPAADGQEPGERPEVSFTPRADRPVERRLDRFIESGDFRLWEADTTVARGDTVPGNVLVLESMVRLEGRVGGTLVAVDSDVFLRPGGTVGGDLVVLGGGMYRSSLATVEGQTVYEPTLLLQAVPRGGGWVVRPVAARPEPVQLDGLSGLRLPTSQRVDGWSFGVGGRFQAVDVAWQPSVHVTGTFHAGGERAVGSVRQLWYPSGDWRFGVEAGRGTRTAERWIRSDAANTLTHVFGGDDYRNYYESDRARLVAAHDLGGGESLRLTAGWERIRSLPAREAGGLFGDHTVEPNPAVDEGDAWIAGLQGRVRRQTGRDSLALDVGIEGADASVAGDFSYLYARGSAVWRIRAALGHVVELQGRARGDLAGDLPGHRWSAIGGAGTLPALDLLQFRGPRLLFGRVTYLVPVPVLRVPRLGRPRILLRAATGTTWGEGEDFDLHQSLVAGVRFLIFEAGVAVDPGDSPGEDSRGFFTVRLPR